MNLLIVNDEKLTADTMKERIDWRQYGINEVYVAYDTEESKLIIEENQIEIMLCDIEMPVENGLSLLRWARTKEIGIECIFLTCYAEFAYAQEAMNLGCQDYILMPIKYEKIGETVLKVVNRIKQQRENDRYAEYGKYMMKEQVGIEDDDSDKKEKKSRKEVVESAIAFIMQNISDNDLSVESISKKFHFHPVYMNRVFKEEKGIAISRYIVNERMKLAVTLMEVSDCSAFEVAKKVGYRQYSNFYNMFKKYYGVSPAEYRDKNIKKNI